MSPSSTERAQRAPRIEAIDWLRGVAVALMILAHGFDAWLAPTAKAGSTYEAIKLLSGIPARLFLFLVGVSAAIQIEAQLKKGVPAGIMRQRLLRRGLQVIALAYLFRLQEWLLSGFYGGWETLVRVDVLNAIGLSMIVLALVTVPKNGRPAVLPALLSSALFLGLGTTIGPAHFPTWLPAPLTSYLGGQRPMSWFPLFPWGAWAPLGVAVGHAWLRASRDVPSARRIFLLSGLVGMALTGIVTLVRWWRPTILTYSSALTYQMGPGVFFHRLGLIGILAALGFLWCRLLNGRFSAMRQLGRTSLLIYWIHIELCYGNLAYPIKGRLDFWHAGMGVVLLALAMLGVSCLKTRYARAAGAGLKRLVDSWRRTPQIPPDAADPNQSGHSDSCRSASG